MAFEERIKWLIGVAMIGGPLLLVVYSLFYMTDEMVPAGVLGFYGGVLLLPSFLWLACLVGKRYSRFGVVCAILGLLGGAILIMGTVERATREMLEREGVSETALDAVYVDVPWQLALVFINGLFFPLSWVLVGIGLYRGRIVERWQAVLLIAGGLSFVIGQGAGVATDGAQVGAMVVLLLGLAPMGWRLVTGGDSQPVGEPAPANP